MCPSSCSHSVASLGNLPAVQLPFMSPLEGWWLCFWRLWTNASFTNWNSSNAEHQEHSTQSSCAPSEAHPEASFHFSMLRCKFRPPSLPIFMHQEDIDPPSLIGVRKIFAFGAARKNSWSLISTGLGVPISRTVKTPHISFNSPKT